MRFRETAIYFFARTIAEMATPKGRRPAGKISEIYAYPGDDHNIGKNFGSAITRSVQFFDKYVKGID